MYRDARAFHLFNVGTISVLVRCAALLLLISVVLGSFFSFPAIVSAATETVTLTTTGVGSWTAPVGVTSVQIEVWAGGGGGGGTAASGNGGGGGAGGGYARETAFTVTPGNSYSYYIGRGGAGGSGTANGSAGHDSMFNASSTVLAVGGPGGFSLANGSAGGATTTGSTAIGDVVFHGGNGGNGTGTSGGGGGGAGDSANGTRAVNNTAGSGGSNGGGNGGAGVSGNNAGNPGVTYGGGGSGADSNNSTARLGGQGAQGQLKLTYEVYTVLADTTDPGNATISGGDAATMAGAFTFQTSTSTDVVSAVVVGLGTGASGGIGLVEITDTGGSTVYGSTSNPASDTPSITLSTNTLTANTTATTYKIRITPKTVVSGGPYTVTAKINSWTSTNTNSGSDTAGTTITINNGPVAPTVSTDAATSVGASSATLNGNITATGGSNATVRGFASSTDSALSTGVATSSESGSFGTGTFTGSMGGLTGNTTYYFRAYATNPGGTGYGTIESFLTIPGAPGTPSYSTTAATSTTVTWSAPSGGAASYRLNQCSGGTCSSFSGLGVTSTTTYSLSGNTTYDYAVIATNASGESSWSATSSVLTLPNIPGTPTFSDTTQTTLRVSWSAPSGGASSYKIERCTGSGCSDFSEITAGETNEFYDDSLLTANTTYRYRIRGTNASGDGLYSSAAEVTTLADASPEGRKVRLRGIRLRGVRLR